MRIDAHPMRIGRCIRMANPTSCPSLVMSCPTFDVVHPRRDCKGKKGDTLSIGKKRFEKLHSSWCGSMWVWVWFYASGAQVFFCFGIKTWGNWGTSNWWLLRERGFLRSFREQAGHTGYFTLVGSSKSHIPSIQGVLPLWAPQKAIWPPYRVFYPCVLLKKPFGTQYNGIYHRFHCFTPN